MGDGPTTYESSHEICQPWKWRTDGEHCNVG
jgi:hypothetical protein